MKYTPTITTTSLSNGTVGTSYSQALAATGSDTITWSVTSGSLPAGLTLEDGVLFGTPTTADTSTFTVKAENSYGSDSKELSITINEPATISVTGVSLDQNTLTLAEDGTAQLTATVEPANATNKDVTWSSDDEAVATVDADGKVTAVGAGTATITVTAADGNKTATCAVTVKHGNMILTPQKDATCTEDSTKNTKDNTVTKSSTPQTSDALFGYAVFFAAIIVLASIVSIVAYRKLHTVQAKHSSSNKH